MAKEAVQQVLSAGPFALSREVFFEQFEEFFGTILEQAALTEDQQKQLGETLKGSIEKRDKLGQCLLWVEAQAEAIRTEEKRLAARRATFEKFYDCIAESIHGQMKELGIKRVEGLKVTFAVQKNPPSVAIEDENAVPAEYIDYVPAISKQRIKDALQAGQEVPGAKLVTDKTRIKIG